MIQPRIHRAVHQHHEWSSTSPMPPASGTSWPVEAFCNACFTGDYPTGDVTREMLTAIEGERCASQSQITLWS